MIAKNVKGKGFRGALAYDLAEHKGRLLATNMAGRSVRELAAEFGQIRKLRPTLGKAVLHVSLSASPGEHLSDAQWTEIAQRYLEAMGLTHNQYVLTRHTDTEHEHVHLLVNRITLSGEVVSDSMDWRRQETLMRRIEQEYGLQSVAPSEQAQRRAPTQGELERVRRTGQPSTRQRLQALCDAALQHCTSFTDYVERLEAVGVEVIPTLQKDDTHLSGLQYRLEGVLMKGYDLGRRYTAAGVQKQGARYDKDRDGAAARRCREREAHRTDGPAARSPEAEQGPQRGRTRPAARTAGPSDGCAHGRDEAHARSDRATHSSPSEGLRHPEPGLAGALEANGAAQQGSPAQPRESEPHAGVALPAADDRDRRDLGGAYERILALAAPAALPAAGDAGHASGRTEPPAALPHAATLPASEALRQQLDALGGTHFELRIRHAQGKETRQQRSRSQLLHDLPHLARANARGDELEIRPAGEAALILLDGLGHEAIARLHADGWTPAVVIEPRPGRFQAWIRLSDTPIEADVTDELTPDLVRTYGADAERSGATAWGRLAGFLAHGPAHAPFYVRVREALGFVARAASQVIETIRTRLRQRAEAHERQRRLDAIHAQAPGTPTDALAEYRHLLAQALRSAGSSPDSLQLDAHVVRQMARSGRWHRDQLIEAILEGSPAVPNASIEAYAQRLVQAAWADPLAEAARRRAQQGGDRGYEMGR